MIAKHGSEEAVREYMKEQANKSARNSNGEGGFAYMKKKDPIKFRRVSSIGGTNKRGYRRIYESEISES